MCGIALLYGDTAELNMPGLMSKLSHRGPDDQHCWLSPDGLLAIGFVRLAINDESSAGRQPYSAGEMIAVFNGEIFNAHTLAKQYRLFVQSHCDTHVIAPLFALLGMHTIVELDGFYSGILYKKGTNTLYLLRDHIGKKPLFYGESDGNLFVVSELKALQNIEWFEQVPIGISELNLLTAKLSQLASHKPRENITTNLAIVMKQAVDKRLPKQQFGIFLSGGLDSSIIAALANQQRQDVIYFVLGNPESEDVSIANILIKYLGLKHVQYVPLPAEEQLPELITKVVYSTESYNPSIISNGLATYLLAQAAQQQDLKVVLTGEGADELFAGYHESLSEQEWQATRSKLITDMHFTELRRLDSCTMAHSIEARCPFLDRAVKQVADSLEHHHFYHENTNKVILRETFASILPPQISQRKKTSFDVGSGLRKLVVNYLTHSGETESNELKKIWKQLFSYDENIPYFFSYPTFDLAIAQRGVMHK